MLLVFSMANRTSVCQHWMCCWIHRWSMYNSTYREGLKLLVGVWMNHLYIQHIKKEAKGIMFDCFIFVIFNQHAVLCIVHMLQVVGFYFLTRSSKKCFCGGRRWVSGRANAPHTNTAALGAADPGSVPSPGPFAACDLLILPLSLSSYWWIKATSAKINLKCFY